MKGAGRAIPPCTSGILEELACFHGDKVPVGTGMTLARVAPRAATCQCVPPNASEEWHFKLLRIKDNTLVYHQSHPVQAIFAIPPRVVGLRVEGSQ